MTSARHPQDGDPPPGHRTRPFQIFVSYSRNDDLAPPGTGSTGFVTALVERLQWEFESQLGPPVPQIWRDQDGRILPSDQFDEVIAQGVATSDVLVVVLSNNWTNRENCQKELAMFEQAHRTASGSVKKQIIVVAKHDMDPNARPELLRGQTAYKFYDERDRETREFFTWPERRADFDREVARLAKDVHARATRDQEAQPPFSALTESNGRKVYVAKPAHDMREWYQKLVEELLQRGFEIVPDPATQFSADTTEAALANIIDRELDKADLSIHLLGESTGFVLADGAEPIVSLQLSRAAARRERQAAGGAEATFQRLIWAPRILITLTGGEPVVVEQARSPQAVFERVATMNEGDSIEGSQFTQFKQFAIDRLLAMAQSMPPVTTALEDGAVVYLQFQETDESYAAAVADALAGFELNLEWSNFSGDDARMRHQRILRECDAVIVCWASGADSRVWSAFDELQDPRKLGRDVNFACRSLVAGPPKNVPGKFMALRAANRKKHEIDLVLDLTAYEAPPPEEFRPFLDAAKVTD